MERVAIIDRCGFEASLRGQTPVPRSVDAPYAYLLPASELSAHYARVLSVGPAGLSVDLSSVLGSGGAAAALTALAASHPDLPREIHRIDVNVVVLNTIELMTAARLAHLHEMPSSTASVLTTVLYAPMQVRVVLCRRLHPPNLIKLIAQYGRQVYDLEHHCVLGG